MHPLSFTAEERKVTFGHMITFEIITEEGKKIPLLGGLPSVQIKSQNSAFQFTAIDSSKAYDIDFPVEGNEEVFGSNHLISAESGVRFFNAIMLNNGKAIEQGLLSVYDSTRTVGGYVYRTDFVVNDFAFRAKGLTIQDVCERIVDLRPSTTTKLSEAAQYYTERLWPETPIHFPMVKNEGFYGSNYGEFLGITNPYDAANQIFREASGINNSGPQPVFDTKFNYVAFVYVLEVFKQIGEYFGYDLKGDLFTNNRIKKAIIEGGLALDSASLLDLASISRSGFTYYTAAAPQQFVDFNAIDQPPNTYLNIDLSSDQPYIIGDTDTKTVEFTVDWRVVIVTSPILINTQFSIHIRTNGTSGNGQTFTESFMNTDSDYISGVINRTRTYSFNYAPAGADVGLGLGVFIVWNNPLTQVLQPNTSNHKLIVSRNLDSTLNDGLEEFRLGDTLPPVPVTSFLKRMKNLFCTTLDVDHLSRCITMNLLQDQGTEEPHAISNSDVAQAMRKLPADLTSYQLTHGVEATVEPANFIGGFSTFDQLPTATLHSTAIVYNENSYYKYVYDPADATQKWEFMYARKDTYTLGTGDQQQITTEIVLPKMVNSDLGGTVSSTALIPEYNHMGASGIYGMPALPSHSLSILWVAGKQPSSNGTYYLATITAFNYLGQLYNGSLTNTMLWTGRYGLLLRYWQRFIKILANNDKLEMSVKLPEDLKRSNTMNQPLLIENQRVVREEHVVDNGIESFSRTVLRKI